jgi:hypothetical protein
VDEFDLLVGGSSSICKKKTRYKSFEFQALFVPLSCLLACWQAKHPMEWIVSFSLFDRNGQLQICLFLDREVNFPSFLLSLKNKFISKSIYSNSKEHEAMTRRQW